MAKKKTPKSTRRQSKNRSDSVVIYGTDEIMTRGKLSRAYGIVDLDDLEQNVQEFVKKIGGIVMRLPKEVGAFELDSIKLSAEVSAKGSLSFLGTGGEVEGRGGIEFEFKRPTEQKAK